MTDSMPTTYLCPITIGRSVEIAALHTFLAQSGGVLLISGEAGVGKTRLVQETRRVAEEQDIAVLEGHCFEADRALPFSPALDILSGLVESRGLEAVVQLAGRTAPDLARLLPELARNTPAADLEGVEAELAKRRLFDGFARFVTT
ncbi:MAG: AAA family ATPase, partial [Thermomicrobiales bacterium]